MSSTLLKYALCLHPQDSINDILLFTGLVRHLYELNENNMIYFVKEKYEILVKKHFNELEDIIYEVVPNFEDKTIFKFIMSKYKNLKNRVFFGMYDKFRFDSYKKKCIDYDALTFNPYELYNYDESLKFNNFRISTLKDDKLIKMIKQVANMDFALFSMMSEDIPMSYKKNKSISIFVNKVFNDTNYFDSVELMDKTRIINLIDSKDDILSSFVYMLWMSGHYNHLFEKKMIRLFLTKYSPFLKDIPSTWKIIKCE